MGLMNDFLDFWKPSKSLSDRLSETKRVRVLQVPFRIRKINALDHLAGSKVMMAAFMTYEEARGAEKASKLPDENDLKKIKDHFRDVFDAAVVEPRLKRSMEDPGEGVFIDSLLNDQDLCYALYDAIMNHSGSVKKKPSA